MDHALPLGPPTLLPVAIVGAGAVARSFAHALCGNAFDVCVVASTDGSRASSLCDELPGTQTAISLPGPPHPLVRIVLVAVSDSAYGPDLSCAIASTFPQALIALHTSGSQLACALNGAAPVCLAFHPAAPFPAGEGAPLTSLHGVFAALEGTDEAVRFGESMALELHMLPFRLHSTAEGKMLYHAACCIASNYTTVTLCAAVETLQRCGELSVSQAGRLVSDLARRAINAVEASAATGRQPSAGLTGPIVRGDGQTVASHVAVLQNEAGLHTYVLSLYRQLGRAAVSMLTADSRLDVTGEAEILRALEFISASGGL
jgi:predicted short-subunit dehydrogenase-like oxidoreductase (DUF2520 family)